MLAGVERLNDIKVAFGFRNIYQIQTLSFSQLDQNDSKNVFGITTKTLEIGQVLRLVQQNETNSRRAHR